jgi:Tfp pilus assembly protein PilO
MIPLETEERRASLKAKLLERLHDPLQLRIVVMGVVLLAGYGGVYMPLAARIGEKTQRITGERKLAELAEGVEQLQAQCRGFAKRLPQNTDGKEWMQYVHEGIRRFPLKLSKLDCPASKQIGPYKAIILQIELEGSFFDVDRFLCWLESNPRLFRADDITIAPGKGKDNKDSMMMKLTVLGMAG